MRNDNQVVGDDDLHAYVDGFLDGAAQIRVERHLSAHPEAAARVAAWQANAAGLRRALSSKAGETVPDALDLANLVSTRGPYNRRGWGIVAGIAAAFLAGTGAGWLGRGSDELHGLASLTRQAAVAQRVFSSDPGAFDRNGKSAAMPVGYEGSSTGQVVQAPDLSAAGYALVGGRLVPTEQGSAAFFVYRNRANQRIGVLVRLMIGIDTDAPLRAVPALGMTGYAWSRNGIGVSLVSASQGSNLRPIAERLRDQTIG